MLPIMIKFLLLALLPLGIVGQSDDDVPIDSLGLDDGYITLKTANFNAQIARKAHILASLKPTGDEFDFLPFDYLNRRARNGQYHWGDVTFRYRKQGETGNWTDGDSSVTRQPVTVLGSSGDVLASSLLGPTLPNGPLNITREWLDVSGDIGLRFNIENAGEDTIELGSLGFPAEFNSIFTNRTDVEMQQLCSLSEPYVGMHAGQIRVSRVRGSGSALVVTPLGDTPLEAYRNLEEDWYDDTQYESQSFEDFYEWQTLSKAWAENEWLGKNQWNLPSSRILAPGQSLQFGVRFSVAKGGVRDLDDTVRSTGTPTAVGVPGYIVPAGDPAQLFLSQTQVSSIVSDPVGALEATMVSPGRYTVTPTGWGRARLSIQYLDGKIQTVHYYITKASTEAVRDLGNFLTTEQYFNDSSDPFHRAPSILTYDFEARSFVTQEFRVWIAGLSDEGGAGSYLAAFMKQVIQPNAEEVAKLEAFLDGVLWGTIQRPDYGVKKSLFFYEPDLVPGFNYSQDFDWTSWMSWNKAGAEDISRAYDYVHVTAAYWSFYRIARAYPDLVKTHTWDWYLNQAFQTAMRIMPVDIFYTELGLMGETVFGELLKDLEREGKTANATTFSAAMRERVGWWNSMEVPFGSEQSWDSTGQEGVYYWSKHFGFADMMEKALNSVLGYTHTTPHWGYNGNARRYWDNIYAGKLQRIERQIHHYGSALNALPVLSAFRSAPNDSYLIRLGYGGTVGPLSNINQEGFAAASFHSWPDTLEWDGYSGDYGPGFLGAALGSGTYVVEDEELGLVAFGGILSMGTDGQVSVRTNDAVRQRVFIGALGLQFSVDAGIIIEFGCSVKDKHVWVTLGQLEGVPRPERVVVWVESPTPGAEAFNVTTGNDGQDRGGWVVPLSSPTVTIHLGPA